MVFLYAVWFYSGKIWIFGQIVHPETQVLFISWQLHQSIMGQDWFNNSLIMLKLSVDWDMLNFFGLIVAQTDKDCVSII